MTAAVAILITSQLLDYIKPQGRVRVVRSRNRTSAASLRCLAVDMTVSKDVRLRKTSVSWPSKLPLANRKAACTPKRLSSLLQQSHARTTSSINQRRGSAPVRLSLGHLGWLITCPGVIPTAFPFPGTTIASPFLFLFCAEPHLSPFRPHPFLLHVRSFLDSRWLQQACSLFSSLARSRWAHLRPT